MRHIGRQAKTEKREQKEIKTRRNRQVGRERQTKDRKYRAERKKEKKEQIERKSCCSPCLCPSLARLSHWRCPWRTQSAAFLFCVCHCAVFTSDNSFTTHQPTTQHNTTHTHTAMLPGARVSCSSSCRAEPFAKPALPMECVREPWNARLAPSHGIME
jgi:hypothetical protein